MTGLDLWDQSAAAWIALMKRGDLNRTLLLDPPMLRLAGEVAGLNVCDVDCGEGRFCRMLSDRGAKVMGLEPTRRLVEEARRRDPRGRYVEAGAEEIPMKSESFDLVVSYLVLIDIPDYRAAIAEMARVARPGGRILVANLNSFCTTRKNAWVRNEFGEPLYVAVDDYFRERGERVVWGGIEVVNHHRPFQSYMRAFIDAGLRLIDFEEPAIRPEDASASPGMADALRVPLFHVMQWRRDPPPGGA